jgi:C4-dicarboxylate transporter
MGKLFLSLGFLILLIVLIPIAYYMFRNVFFSAVLFIGVMDSLLFSIVDWENLKLKRHRKNK